LREGGGRGCRRGRGGVCLDEGGRKGGGVGGGSKEDGRRGSGGRVDEWKFGWEVEDGRVMVEQSVRIAGEEEWLRVVGIE
jgi:hypothetical protein